MRREVFNLYMYWGIPNIYLGYYCTYKASLKYTIHLVNDFLLYFNVIEYDKLISVFYN